MLRKRLGQDGPPPAHTMECEDGLRSAHSMMHDADDVQRGSLWSLGHGKSGLELSNGGGTNHETAPGLLTLMSIILNTRMRHRSRTSAWTTAVAWDGGLEAVGGDQFRSTTLIALIFNSNGITPTTRIADELLRAECLAFRQSRYINAQLPTVQCKRLFHCNKERLRSLTVSAARQAEEEVVEVLRDQSIRLIQCCHRLRPEDQVCSTVRGPPSRDLVYLWRTFDPPSESNLSWGQRECEERLSRYPA